MFCESDELPINSSHYRVHAILAVSTLLLADYPNLYADMSAGSGFNALSRDEDFTAGFLHRHRKKLLFGSDCPCFDGRGANFDGVCYSTRLQQFLRRMVKDDAALQAI